MSLLGDAMAWLGTTMDTAAGVAVVYRRKQLSCVLDAAPDSTMLRVMTVDGVSRILWTDRSYAFAAAALILGGVPAEPQDGDLIDETVGGAVVRHEVLPPADGEQSWKYLDAHRVRVQVHTKYIKTNP